MKLKKKICIYPDSETNGWSKISVFNLIFCSLIKITCNFYFRNIYFSNIYIKYLWTLEIILIIIRRIFENGNQRDYIARKRLFCIWECSIKVGSRISYTNAFKMHVSQYANKNSDIAITLRFDIGEYCLRYYEGRKESNWKNTSIQESGFS